MRLAKIEVAHLPLFDQLWATTGDGMETVQPMEKARLSLDKSSLPVVKSTDSVSWSGHAGVKQTRISVDGNKEAEYENKIIRRKRTVEDMNDGVTKEPEKKKKQRRTKKNDDDDEDDDDVDLYFQQVEEEQDLSSIRTKAQETNFEADEEWIVHKSTGPFKKTFKEINLYVGRAFLVNQRPDNIFPTDMDYGRILGIVSKKEILRDDVEWSPKDHLFFKYYSLEEEGRKKRGKSKKINWQFIKCDEFIKHCRKKKIELYKDSQPKPDLEGCVLTGRVVEVDWGEAGWLFGQIKAYNTTNKKYSVKFEDGDEKELEKEQIIQDLCPFYPPGYTPTDKLFG